MHIYLFCLESLYYATHLPIRRFISTQNLRPVVVLSIFCIPTYVYYAFCLLSCDSCNKNSFVAGNFSDTRMKVLGAYVCSVYDVKAVTCDLHVIFLYFIGIHKSVVVKCEMFTPPLNQKQIRTVDTSPGCLLPDPYLLIE